MEKYKVFFDTNAIRNTDFNTFFGSQDKLKDLQKTQKVEILIPEIVMEEIISQKKREYNRDLDSIKSNKLYKLFSEKLNEIIIFNIEDKIKELKENPDLEYKIVNLKNKDILDDLIKLVINNEAPFEEKSDKGFKDAIIYFTIKQYIEDYKGNDKILCCTQDKRLKEALEKLGVEIKDNIDDIKTVISGKYHTDEFIKLLNDSLKRQLDDSLKIYLNDNFKISKDNIEYLYSNHYEDDIVAVSLEKLENDRVLVEIFNNKVAGHILESKKNDYLKGNNEYRDVKIQNFLSEQEYHEDDSNSLNRPLRFVQNSSEDLMTQENIIIQEKMIRSMEKFFNAIYPIMMDINKENFEKIKKFAESIKNPVDIKETSKKDLENK